MDPVQELLQRCRAARQRGMDFPGVWHEILKRHPLVASLPVQQHHGGKSTLAMRLITGAWLVCEEASYSVR